MMLMMPGAVVQGGGGDVQRQVKILAHLRPLPPMRSLPLRFGPPPPPWAWGASYLSAMCCRQTQLLGLGFREP